MATTIVAHRLRRATRGHLGTCAEKVQTRAPCHHCRLPFRRRDKCGGFTECPDAVAPMLNTVLFVARRP
jgi:hypothetical protein